MTNLTKWGVKKVKKILIALTILLIITGCEVKPAVDQENPEVVKVQEESLLDKYKRIQPLILKTELQQEISENIYEIRVTIPQFSGNNEDRAIELINGQIRKDIDNYIERMGSIKKVEEGEHRPFSYSFSVEPEVMTNENGILSISLNMNEYRGGAHGNYWSKLYNFDLLGGKEIKLKDFFKEDVDYLELIYQNIFKQIEDNELWTSNLKGYYYEDKVELSFFIEDGRIKIYFPAYGLGSYADGEQVFEIPQGALEGKLSDFGEVVYSVHRP